MNRIIFQIEEDLLEELDAAANEERTSRSAFVRHAVVMTLAERRRRRELEQVIDSYTAEPAEPDLVLPKAAIQKAWPE